MGAPKARLRVLACNPVVIGNEHVFSIYLWCHTTRWFIFIAVCCYEHVRMYVCELRSEEYLVRHLSFPLWKASIIALKYSPKGIRGARNYGFSNGTVIDGRSKSILVLFPASDIHMEIDTHVGLSSLLFPLIGMDRRWLCGAKVPHVRGKCVFVL